MVVAGCVIHNLGVLARLPHFTDAENARNHNFNEEVGEEVNHPEDPDILARGWAMRQRVVNFLERHRQG